MQRRPTRSTVAASPASATKDTSSSKKKSTRKSPKKSPQQPIEADATAEENRDRKSTAVTRNLNHSVGSGTTTPDSTSRVDTEDELRSSTRFNLLRSVLMLIIFFLLWTLTQRYILEPTFQPHRTEAYAKKQEMLKRQQINARACPAGMECNFELKEEYKL